ncbi:MAG: nitroreductase family protein [Candidatus Woesearchaeota archaeon]|jgi:nitroreductase
METFDCIYTRRSIRKYQKTDVEFDKVTKILEAASKAPSAGNLQAYRFIILQDRDVINQLPDMCSDQFWITEAPIVIVVCEDIERIEAHYGLRGQRLYAIQDCAAATQNIMLAAHDLGLSTCWIGSFEEDYVADLCGVPTTARVQALITLGYAAQEPDPKSEEPLDVLVYFNKYGARVANMNMVTHEFSKEIRKYTKRLDAKTEKGLKESKEKATSTLQKFKDAINRAKKKKI